MPEAPPDTPLSAALYLVATPIGNLADITVRALDVLRGADLVLAEDTRRTRKLLTHYDIPAALKSLHEHNERGQAEGLAARVAAGESIALVSDAGTPLISDPGHALVRAVIDAGAEVVPIPGPSAVIAALSASGLALDRFEYCGFAPRKSGARKRLFEQLAGQPGTLVFLESPHRLEHMLGDAADVFGDRPVAVARELTKVHEEIIRGTLPEVADQFAGTEIRGEITVCIAGADAAEKAAAPLVREDLEARLAAMLEQGTPRNEALRTLAREHGVPRREVYRILLVEEEETH